MSVSRFARTFAPIRAADAVLRGMLDKLCDDLHAIVFRANGAKPRPIEIPVDVTVALHTKKSANLH